MFKLFGGKNKALNSEIDAALVRAASALSANSLEGRQAAFNALMPVLKKAGEAKVEDRHLEMFMSLGDIYSQGGDWETALSAYSDAISANNGAGIGNEQLHLRLGKAQFEMDNEDRAADELCRAYMGGGKEIFDNEDPRYFEFLKTKIEPGPGGW
jgi:tetratricopeptide (TPR) repeat protein